MQRHRISRSERPPRIVKISYGPPHVATIPRAAWAAIRDVPLPELSGRGRTVTLRHAELTSSVAVRESSVLIFAGLVEVVQRLLQERNYWVETNQMVWRHYERANDEVLTGENLTELQQSLLTATNGRGNSLIVAPRLAQRLECIEAICERFPSENVVAIASNKKTVQDVAAAMKHRIQRTVTSGSRAAWHYGNLLHVDATAGFLGRCHEFPVVIWLGECTLPERTQRDLLKRAYSTLWFGFIDRPLSAIHPIDALTLEAFFGPVVADLTRLEDTLTSVTVVWLPAAAYPAGRPSTSLDRKRDVFWKNAARNQLLAIVAAALGDGDQRALQSAGVDSIKQLVQPRLDTDGLTVAIVVENREHGRQLLSHLPRWSLIDAPDKVLLLGEIPRQAIVTLPVAQECWPDADVVIYAAGNGDHWIDGCGPPGIPLRDSMLVIDVADDVDEEARDHCRWRDRDYSRRRWLAAGVRPAWLPAQQNTPPQAIGWT